MAVPIYDDNDDIDSCPTSAVNISSSSQIAGQLSPKTAKFVQYYIETQQHQLDKQQLEALKAWRTKYLTALQQQQQN